MGTITAIVLTFNEEIHLGRCIKSLQPVCDEIVVVDSFSTDRTCEIAKELGARVYQNPFVNQAVQFNWALENCDIQSDWIWRVDADEYAEANLISKIPETLKNIADDVNGIYVNKKIVFKGRPLMHGGWYPAQQIKIIRRGFGASENKWMDEHLIIFSGLTISINGDQTDENLRDITWWTEKHNKYASREAINMLMMAYELDDQENEVKPDLFGNGAQRKRWMKLKYANSPLFLRPFLNFFVRYILKAGFLDGKEGFMWYMLQGFWYRMLVDTKIYEIKKRFDWDDTKIKEWIIKEYL